MYLRLSDYFFLILFCTSCNYFSSDTKQSLQEINTVVDFTKVDVSPSFKNCDSLIDKKKTDCFRKTIHQQIIKNLQGASFSAKQHINETVKVVLQISKKGEVSFKRIESSNVIKKQLPEFVKLIKIAVDSLPRLNPAIKRGITVNTQYVLPIKIQTK